MLIMLQLLFAISKLISYIQRSIEERTIAVTCNGVPILFCEILLHTSGLVMAAGAHWSAGSTMSSNKFYNDLPVLLPGTSFQTTWKRSNQSVKY